MNTAWTKGALIACMCICTVGGLVLMATGDYGRLTPDITQEPAQEYSSKKSEAPLTSHSNHSQIARLFGQVMGKAKEVAPSQSLPETRLNLILKGTFTHEDSDKASALISEASKDTSRYFIGDDIPGAAKLVAVNKGEVTLRRNGQDELLKLPYLKENSLKVDERTAHNEQRRAFSTNKTNSLSNNSQTSSNPSINKENANNPRQQQLKDRLARLRHNNSND